MVHACLTILIIFVLKGLSEYINNVSMEMAGQRIINSMQKKFFSSIINTHFHFFQEIHTGDLSSVLINDVRIIKDTILKIFNDAIQHTLLPLFLVFVMMRNNPFLTLMCLWIVPLIFLLLKKVQKKVRELAQTSSRQSSDLQTFFYEVFNNIILIKSSGTRAKESAKINSKLSSIEKNAWGLSKIRGAMHPIVEILGGLAIVTSIMIGGWQVVQHEKTVGSFFSFIVSVLFIYPSLKKLASVRCKIQEGLSSYQIMEDIIQKAQAEQDKIDNNKAIPSTKPCGPITVQNLCFSYPNHDEPIIKNLNCTFQEKCFTVLIGPSGSGKTTLFYLLMKLYEPTKGNLFWGNQKIDSMPTEFLRKNISFVSQNNHLFEGSIFYNIAYGTTASRHHVVQAAKKAFAHEFIDRLPEQYDTVIRSNGINLSGGQSQRIALARAFLRDAPLVLLDESTSALDGASEKKIIDSIAQLKETGKIVVAIAHRPSMIQQADHVLSIQDSADHP